MACVRVRACAVGKRVCWQWVVPRTMHAHAPTRAHLQLRGIRWPVHLEQARHAQQAQQADGVYDSHDRRVNRARDGKDDLGNDRQCCAAGGGRAAAPSGQQQCQGSTTARGAAEQRRKQHRRHSRAGWLTGQDVYQEAVAEVEPGHVARAHYQRAPHVVHHHESGVEPLDHVELDVEYIDA